jgi:hypothetical protein
LAPLVKIDEASEMNLTNITQAISNGVFNIPAIRSGIFGRNEDISPGETALPNSVPGFLFISIGLGGVCIVVDKLATRKAV